MKKLYLRTVCRIDMELYDIVDSLNKVVKLDGRLMLNRSMTAHKRFPAYKCFNYVVWKVRNSTDKVRMFTYVETINTSNLDLVKCWENADKDFLVELLKWITKEGYNHADEQISDGID